ncbi:MarR family transcriptional regulator [Pseudarthrobacter sp. PS3-L1]|uniref:MarR family winged helix-turn-helix transcriptional regulator n=1 Tax=Pseudarthrobacter sp. PS3-L1 TaxID=3046207 RepID=UPI0024BB530D|nr:MarR family transcriptional regulator [Pseudarthrobacter sp. PS3-L1]MDJ0318995.1 MarR family transcriptional regulator [Pseudarthrobacter sp. PS3-L1]
MTDDQWLTGEQLNAWVRFAAILQLFPAVLDAQLQRESDLTHFEYFTLAMLSEAPEQTLRMSVLAGRTNATLPRLSRVISHLEARGFVRRAPCRLDRRATDATLTEAGWEKVVATAPGHVDLVKTVLIETLTAKELGDLSAISAKLLKKLDPESRMAATAII